MCLYGRFRIFRFSRIVSVLYSECWISVSISRFFVNLHPDLISNSTVSRYSEFEDNFRVDFVQAIVEIPQEMRFESKRISIASNRAQIKHFPSLICTKLIVLWKLAFTNS